MIDRLALTSAVIGRSHMLAPIALLVAALSLSLWVRLDPIAPRTAVYSVDKT